MKKITLLKILLILSFATLNAEQTFLYKYKTNIPLKNSSSLPENGVCDDNVCYYGEIPVEELISGSELANLVGLSYGNLRYPNAPWLHLSIDNKELLIASKMYKEYVSWDQLNLLDLVYGNKTILINNKQYKIRLMSCSNGSNMTLDYSGSSGSINYDNIGTHGSEWNRIMYRLYDGISAYSNNKTTSEEPLQSIANYSESDLDVQGGSRGNAYTWCQESYNGGEGRIQRGAFGISFVYSHTKGQVASWIGWRPVLEPL